MTVLQFILTDCRKDDKYEYFDDYAGNWQFRVYRRSWGNPMPGFQFDTIYSLGSISILSDNRGLKIDYIGGRSVFVWVENDTILYKIGKIGIIRDDEIQFGYAWGSMAFGTSDQIYGIKKVTPEILNEPPTTVTSPATGVILKGATLRGVVNAKSFTADVGFEYGTSESYGSTAVALPGIAVCDMETHVKTYLSGLEPITQYHYRTKVVSSAGTVYGDDMTFTTTGYSEPVTDIEGNVYKTIQIGTQLWMAENLKVTKFSNGDTIAYMRTSPPTGGLETGSFCYYNNQEGNKDIYGALYNFYAVDDDRKLCPSGWHVPGTEELSILVTMLYPNSGSRLKESGLSHWIGPNTGADNSSGFTALPGGSFGKSFNQFSGMGAYGSWWSSTEGSYSTVRCLILSSSYDKAWLDIGNKEQLYSVRCVKN